MNMLKNELLREVGTLARCVHAISDVQFRDCLLQKGQFIFLTRICENPGINLIDLSKMLKVDKTTTSKAVRKLIVKGYVEKYRDAEDQRMWRVYPLGRGLETYPLLIDEENRNIDACLTGFTEAEITKALLLLKKMRLNIDGRWKKVID